MMIALAYFNLVQQGWRLGLARHGQIEPLCGGSGTRQQLYGRRSDKEKKEKNIRQAVSAFMPELVTGLIALKERRFAPQHLPDAPTRQLWS